MWQELAKLIATLIDRYQKLEKLNEEKRSVLTMVNLKELERIVGQEEAIADDINKIEKQRLELINRMASSNVKITVGMNMKDVWSQCPDSNVRDLLRRSHTMLSELVKRVQEAKDNNEILIRAALNAINFKLNQLGGTSVEPAYGQKGQEIVTSQKNFDIGV